MNLGKPIFLKVSCAESFESCRLGVRVMVSGLLPFQLNRIPNAIRGNIRPEVTKNKKPK